MQNEVIDPFGGVLWLAFWNRYGLNQILKDKQKFAKGRTGKGNVACARTQKCEIAQGVC